MGGKKQKAGGAQKGHHNNKKGAPEAQKQRAQEKQEQRNMRHFHRRRNNRIKYGGAEWHSDFKKLTEQLAPFGLTIKDVAGDGNCLFRALADQIENAPTKHEQYREKIMKFVEENRDMFEPFVEDDVPFEQYVENMKRNGSWGGNIEIQAASLLYNVNVIIHQLDQPRWEIVNFEDAKTKTIHLSVRAINGDLPSATTVSPKIISYCCSVSEPAKGTSYVDGPPSDFEVTVMEASGCNDINQVREALLDNDYDYDATIAFLMMLQQTNVPASEITVDPNNYVYYDTTQSYALPNDHKEGIVHEIAHTVHNKISHVLHHHDHSSSSGKKGKKKQQQQQQLSEVNRDMKALCI